MSTKKLAPSVTARDPEGLKFMAIIEAAYNKSGLHKDEARRVNRALSASNLISNLISENRLAHRLMDGEVRSKYVHPNEYKGPKPIVDEIKALAEIFDLNPSQAIEFAKSLSGLPRGAEGWFAVPSVGALAAKYFPEVTDPGEKYCHAVKLVHEKIAGSRLFYNYRQGLIDATHMRVHARTARVIDKIAQTQKGDILIVAGQLGMSNRGRCVKLAHFAAPGFFLSSSAPPVTAAPAEH